MKPVDHAWALAAVSLLLKRVCTTISREYAFRAGEIEIPDTELLTQALKRARGQVVARPMRRD